MFTCGVFVIVDNLLSVACCVLRFVGCLLFFRHKCYITPMITRTQALRTLPNVRQMSEGKDLKQKRLCQCGNRTEVHEQKGAKCVYDLVSV